MFLKVVHQAFGARCGPFTCIEGTVDNLERAKLDYIIFLVDFRSFVSQIVSQ